MKTGGEKKNITIRRKKTNDRRSSDKQKNITLYGLKEPHGYRFPTDGCDVRVLKDCDSDEKEEVLF